MKKKLYAKLLAVVTSLSSLRFSLFLVGTFHKTMNEEQLSSALDTMAECLSNVYKDAKSLLEYVRPN